MKALLRLTIKLVLILTFALLCFFGYKFCYMIFDTEAVEENESLVEEATVRLDSSMSISEVAKALENAGVVENASVFRVQFKVFTAKGTTFIAGTYTLNNGMTAEEIIETITTVSEEETEE
ncbi:MAG: endolytic transglycosylase MltG [Eubacterium sp.]|nr:endolytic transglycosylase MltG [Eubacterium sp.]